MIYRSISLSSSVKTNNKKIDSRQYLMGSKRLSEKGKEFTVWGWWIKFSHYKTITRVLNERFSFGISLSVRRCWKSIGNCFLGNQIFYCSVPQPINQPNRPLMRSLIQTTNLALADLIHLNIIIFLEGPFQFAGDLFGLKLHSHCVLRYLSNKSTQCSDVHMKC